MRIAYCIINYNKREGTSKAIAEVAERLAGRHEVHVFARSAEGGELTRIKWHRMRSPAYPHLAEFLGYVWPCSRAVRPGMFDIIHAAGSVFADADVYTIQNIQPAKRRVLGRLASAGKVSFVRRLTRGAYLRVTGRWERRCYERVAPRLPVFLPVSRGVESELREYYDIGNSRCVVVPNAADSERFRPVSPETKRETRASLGIAANDFVCAFSGGEWRRKGLDLAIESVGQIKNPLVKLLVLGRDDHAGEFYELSRACGVAGRVIFAGFQPSVERALACADVFLFPSRYEALSLAMLEAAACGLPVVATKINGSAEFVEPGVMGEFIDFDPVQIALVIERLCAKTPVALAAMGEAARRRVVQEYNWDKIAAMTEAIYQSVKDERK